MGSAVKIDTLKVAFFCLQTTTPSSLGYPASAGFVFHDPQITESPFTGAFAFCSIPSASWMATLPSTLACTTWYNVPSACIWCNNADR